MSVFRHIIEELSNVQLLLISIVRNLTILSLVMCFMVMIYVNTIVSFMEALSFAVVLMVPCSCLSRLHDLRHLLCYGLSSAICLAS